MSLHGLQKNSDDAGRVVSPHHGAHDGDTMRAGRNRVARVAGIERIVDRVVVAVAAGAELVLSINGANLDAAKKREETFGKPCVVVLSIPKEER